ncbi:hypothetical protein U1Q18_039467 [Sarracenia purpurea var. burkii]
MLCYCWVVIGGLGLLWPRHVGKVRANNGRSEVCSPLEDRTSGAVDAHVIQKEVSLGAPEGHSPELFQSQALKKSVIAVHIFCLFGYAGSLFSNMGSALELGAYGVVFLSGTHLRCCCVLERCCYVLGIGALSSSTTAIFDPVSRTHGVFLCFGCLSEGWAWAIELWLSWL